MVSSWCSCSTRSQHAHEQGVWHRDIKPANLIIMTSGKLKIADFGIARIDSSNLTQIGAVMGTPGYMAPEQYVGADVDWRADIFAAGVVLYQLLTRRAAVRRVDRERSRTRSATRAAAAVAGRASTACPSAYDAVVARAIEKKPEERFQNANEFRSALLDAYAAPVSPTVSEETIITEIVATTIRIEPTSPSQGRTRPTCRSRAPTAARLRAVKTTHPPPGWDPAVLKAIEGHLARFVGPVARVMLKRAALQTTDVDSVYGILGEQLSGAEEQKAFLATRTKLPGAPPPKPLASTRTVAIEAGTLLAAKAAGAPLTADMIAAATRKLTEYVGPIAKVIVKKAAGQASTSRQFYLLLADSLTTEAERAKFLDELGAGH